MNKNRLWLLEMFESEEHYQKGEVLLSGVYHDHQEMKNWSAECSKELQEKFPDLVSTYYSYVKDDCIDPKKIGIPNIQFSIAGEDEKYKEQRVKRGFDDSETWSLADTIAAFIIPRLERYIELVQENTQIKDEEIEQLESIATAMKLTVRDKGLWDFDAKEKEQVDEGLQALKDNWFNLWW